MQLPRTLIVLMTALLPPTISAPLDAQNLLTLLDHHSAIPSRYESTLLARRLLALSPTGVLSTVFPSESPATEVDAFSSPPPSVAHTPIALPDYLADCEDSGNPTLLALSVSTSTRNAVAGSNVSLAISWWDTYSKLTHREPWSAANLPRASLIGYLEEMSEQDITDGEIVACYTKVHRDSRLWLPGNKNAAHFGKWMRMVVQETYWIGGFGDRAYIGWFEPADWRNIKRSDWEGVRLPGES